MSDRAAMIAWRVWFGIADRLLPGVVERQGARLFLTPPRPKVGDAAFAHAPVMTFGGHRVRTLITGTGPTVVLLHGWGGSGADMLALSAAVTAAGFRAVTIDLPAHGGSPGRRTSVIEWVELMRGVAEDMGPLHAIVAHSLGATAALLAIGDGVRAGGIVAIAPTMGPEFHLARRSAMAGIPAARVPGILRELERRVGRRVAELDVRSVAARVDVPVLLLHAPEDRAVPWAHAEVIAGALPACTLVEMPGLGHRRILSEPASVERAVTFVRALER